MWSKRYKVGYIASVVTLNFLIFGLMYTSISRVCILIRGCLGEGESVHWLTSGCGLSSFVKSYLVLVAPFY
jgi:hypothetical protein